MFQRILSLGLKENVSEEEIQKYQIANFLVFFFILFGISFSIIVLFTCPELLFIAITFFVFMGICFLLNYLQAINLSCLILSWAPALAAASLEAGVMDNGEEMIASLQTLVLALQITPWLCYRKNDYHYLIPAVIGGFILFLLPTWLNPVLDYNVDSSFWRSGLVFYIALINSFLLLSGAIAFLNSQRNAEKKKNDDLVESLKQQSLQMKKSQDEVNASLEEVKRARIEDEKRTWISIGLTELNHFLRTQNEQKEFYPSLISIIVKYVGANQGSLFRLGEDGSEAYLNLEGCYAYDRRKFMEKRIHFGEGLVGQCYLEGEKIILTEVPDGYYSITSGLGESLPKFILIMPLKFNDKVEGIIELASFQEMDKYQIEYIEKAGEIIASTVNQLKISATTKILLEQAQQQTLELQNQEEEMRQNMEELRATQDDATRKEMMNLEKIQELEEEVKRLRLLSDNSVKVA